MTRYVDTLSSCPECEQYAIDNWEEIVDVCTPSATEDDTFWENARGFLDRLHGNEHSTFGLFAMQDVSW